MRTGGFIAGVSVLLLLSSHPVWAQETFLGSQRYGAEGAIVGVLLTDDDYGRMVRKAEHLEAELDWAWVAGDMKKSKVKSLGFSPGDYRTVVVPPPGDHTAEQIDGLTRELHEALLITCKRLGWTPSDQGDLILETAIVDIHDPDGYGITNFFNATSKHSAEFEIRLTESATGGSLLAVRHETHSANLIGAAWRATAHLTAFLATPAPPSYAAGDKTIALDLYEMPQSAKKKKKKPHKLEKYANPREITLGALRDSMLFAGVVDGAGEADYRLDIHVREANLVGAYQTTINVNAIYTLTDNETGQVVLEEEVGTSATMSALEVTSGGKRLKRVTPAAFLDNVDVFLYRLNAALDSG